MVFSCFPGKPDPDRVIFRSKNNFLNRRFWKKIQILNQLFSNASDFEVKMIFEKKNRVWWKSSFQKIIFGCFYTVRTPKFVAMRFSKRMILGKNIEKKRFEMMTFEENQILKLLFQQRYRFSIKISKTRQTFSQLYTTQKNVNRKFYRVSGFEMKALRRIRFWSENDFRKTEFDENFPFKISLLDLYTP